ncbi:MAG: hypothetical protein H6721_32615 [Sandaracinus sp.]|nr:hypothetical protein [Myxococcales bacterium]MCB9613381.1 hypothetical protein [Sandaracinus sp.]MCB9636879.1 hypothetical protein [Sandaracinus sp.]
MTVRGFALVLLGLASAGCGGVMIHPYDVLPATARQMEERAEEDAPVERRGWVRLHVQPQVEGAMFRNERGAPRQFYQVDVPDPSPEVASDRRARYEFYREALGELRRQHGTAHVVQLRDFVPALEAALQYHLARHFEHVDTSAEAGVELRLGGGEVRHNTMNKRAELLLVTDAASAEGRGARNTAGHLGWAIPVGMTTVGAVIVSMVFPKIHRRDFERAVARAIDAAAAELASQLATRCRQAPIEGLCG